MGVIKTVLEVLEVAVDKGRVIAFHRYTVYCLCVCGGGEGGGRGVMLGVSVIDGWGRWKGGGCGTRDSRDLFTRKIGQKKKEVSPVKCWWSSTMPTYFVQCSLMNKAAARYQKRMFAAICTHKMLPL